ncbi:MAG: hypothetical protein M1821_000240 [Bathelium mastoideum]|nr:MAG: hypothetical protein M1821_000240 [Bathelium mastoideum]
MPLRARIMDAAFTGSRLMSTDTDIPRELPGDEPDDVLFNNIYGVRTIELNRPKKLNSLNGSMARKIVPRLKEWEKSQLANVIVIKGAGRAFCAGGDVAVLAQQNTEGPKGQKASSDYFALEYQLDHLIATYSKPYVAFMDGITMGGGVGLSVHAPFRIATEKTIFAMPETTIGFFPDVGGSFFLPRLDGEIGTYLALTSEQLKGANVFYNGIATHYLDSTSLPDLEARLAELNFRDSADYETRLAIIDATIAEFATGLPSAADSPRQLTGAIRTAIDTVFSPRTALTPQHLISALTQLASDTAIVAPEVREWAGKTRATILERSPTSVAVTLRLLREGARWSVARAFQHEHALATRFMATADFVEGVTARLVRKPAATPQWSPASLEDVNAATVSKFLAFGEENGVEPLRLLNSGPGADYQEYPHRWIGLPAERDVEARVQQRRSTAEEVVAEFVQERRGKQGVREKVEEILGRKTEVVDGVLAWRN